MAAANLRPNIVPEESGEAADFDIGTNRSLHVHPDNDRYGICQILNPRERIKIVYTFFYSGLHIPHPPKINDVYAVAEITSQDGRGARGIIIGKNQRGVIHAERDLINKLRSFFNTSQGIVNIKIWINFSPCHRCSEKLLSFFQEKIMYINSRIIVFPFLYRIHERRNVVGLKQLELSGISLSTFSKADWAKLRQLLYVSPEDCIFPPVHTAARTGQDQGNASRLSDLMTIQIDLNR